MAGVPELYKKGRISMSLEMSEPASSGPPRLLPQVQALFKFLPWLLKVIDCDLEV